MTDAPTIVFSTEGCTKCQHIISELERVDFPYEERDAQTLMTPTPRWREEGIIKAMAVLHMHHMALPVILCGGMAYTYEEFCESLGIVPGAKGDREAVMKALSANNKKYGHAYCPCVAIDLIAPSRRKAYICPCEDYRERGVCQCGLHG